MLGSVIGRPPEAIIVTHMNRCHVADILDLDTELVSEGRIDRNDTSTNEIGHEGME